MLWSCTKTHAWEPTLASNDVSLEPMEQLNESFLLEHKTAIANTKCLIKLAWVYQRLNSRMVAANMCSFLQLYVWSYQMQAHRGFYLHDRR